ncbi:MAG: shikimate dehydrogenase [Rhizobiaceae bacterium]|nr:shikimate dehydrogenase [Rhizobiaceae bacterium]
MAEHKPRAFVCGHPIGHSRSPLIHGYWLNELGIAGSYEPIDIAPDDFAGFMGGLVGAGWAGGNITIPHKEQAFALAAKRDAAAEHIGAVNTLWVEGRTIVGGNTDAFGFAANLDARAGGWRSAETAIVLGAGGAARAVVHALREAGLNEVLVVNRSAGRADDIAAHFGGKVSGRNWSDLDSLLPRAGLLVNTTSLGMKGQPDLEIDISSLPDGAVVSDIIYAPLETPLLAQARARGLAAVDGLGMLLHQAVPGFERWFGIRPVVSDALRAYIVADLE